MMPWLLLILGLAILLVAGDMLVRGAVNLALRIGIPALIVSLTVVAFGTSAPELLISVNAVLDGKPGLALGNVVGSNTANALLVLGLPAIIATMHTSQIDTRKTFLMMLAASVLFIALCFVGPITWISALILLAALALVLFGQARDALAHRRAGAAAVEVDELEGVEPGVPGWRIAIYLVVGLIGLPVGADLMVDNASIIARRYGMSDTVIGLTLVALGTSLPELATTIMAAIRRQAEVAVGNVIGSNMFNLLGIIGVAGLVGNIPVDEELLRFDLWVMLAASIVLAPFVFLKWDITRVWGVVLSALYIAYVLIVLA